MSKSHDYIAPRHSPLLIWLAKTLWPVFMRSAKKVTSLSVVDDGLERLSALAGQRIVICPNHACEDDAEVIFGLSRLAKEDFYYLTAHEIFHGHRGWNFFLLPEVGCYSVTRGTPDTHAYRTTRQILVDNKLKLVVFPEGEISHFNDVVMPLEPGVAHISFSALRSLRKKGISDDIKILPVAILYNYIESIQPALDSAMVRLERYCKINRVEGFKERLLCVVLHVIGKLEKEHNVDAGTTDFARRIYRLREKMIDDVASHLEIERPDEAIQLEFAHTVKSALCDSFFHSSRRQGKEVDRQKLLYRQIVTAIDLIALEKCVLFNNASVSNQDEIAEIVHWLERVILGKNAVYGKRRIMMQIGEPISLCEYASQYGQDETATSLLINKRIRLALLNMLKDLGARRTRPEKSTPSQAASVDSV